VKLATLKDGSRDGVLAVVSRDLATACPARAAATLLDALERWPEVEPALRAEHEALESRTAAEAFAFDPRDAAAPLPRAPQWLDGSVFTNHGRLMQQALHPDRVIPDGGVPLVYQGASDDFLGPREDIVASDEAEGIDFEGEVAVIVDDVAMATSAADAGGHLRLLLLVNDVSLRSYVARELGTGFGFIHAKPSTAFSPVAVTPDELANAWDGGRVHLPLRVEWNGEWFGEPNAGEMTYDFTQIVEHVTRTRRLRAGTIVGSGTVSNADRSAGSACISERRALETIEHGEPRTGFMRFGDRVRIEMLGADGRSIFGAIEQRVVRYAPTAP
jgi:naringenin degradation protein FdeI